MLTDFGAELVEVGEGFATIRMTLGARSVQAHGIAHGGALFTLADGAFGVACNTGPNRAVAQHCTISYLAPAQVGEELTVAVRRNKQTGRTGIYDGTIVTGEGRDIA